MRNVLLQLHVGHPEACKGWGNVPVSHGLQLTIYTEATSGEPVRIARHLYAMLRRELMLVGGLEGRAPCEVTSGHIFEAFTCAGAVSGLTNRVMVYIADGNPVMASNFEDYFGCLSPLE